MAPIIVLGLFLYHPSVMVETIGEAFSLGWQLKARCGYGNREGLKSVRQCVWTYDLDMLTLVATRGRDFPLSMVAGRLRCPRCGSRSVAVVFMPPSDGDRRRGPLKGNLIDGGDVVIGRRVWASDSCDDAAGRAPIQRADRGFIFAVAITLDRRYGIIPR